MRENRDARFFSSDPDSSMLKLSKIRVNSLDPIYVAFTWFFLKGGVAFIVGLASNLLREIAYCKALIRD